MYQPVYQPAKSTADTLKGLFFSNMALAIATALGLLLMMIGALVYGLSSDPDVWDFGFVMQAFGMLFLVGAMLLGALVRQDFDKHVRMALIIGAVLLLIFIGFWGVSVGTVAFLHVG